MPARTILVTGAAGFIGSYLLPHLLAEGASVVAGVRDPARCRMHANGRLRIVRADLGDPASLLAATAECDAVVHLAAATDVSDRAVNRRSNVDGVRNLVRACETRGLRRLIHFSTHCAGRKLRDAYGETKLEGEQLALASRLDTTVLRPTMVCGRGSKEFETFVTLVRRLPVIPVIGPGTFALRPSLVEDVVPLVSRALSNPATVGRTYEIAGADAYTFRTLVDLVAGLLGKRRRVLSVPPGLVMPFVRLAGALTVHTPVAVDQLLALLQDTEADIEPARRDLDFRPRPLASGLGWLAEG